MTTAGPGPKGAEDARRSAYVSDAPFPSSVLHADADFVFSIVCTSSHYHWALHKSEGQQEKFFPSLIWRTGALTEKEIDARGPKYDACEMLEYYLPRPAQELLFGTFVPFAPQPKPKKKQRQQEAKLDRQAAMRVGASKRMPVTPVYILATNREHEDGIRFLLRDLPVILHRLKSEDFFSKLTGDGGDFNNNDCSIAVDCLAAVKAAQIRAGSSPVLVIHGDAALTYVASDPRNEIVGYGISPGIQMQLVLPGVCGDGELPILTRVDAVKTLKNCAKEKRQLSCFAKDVESEIISSVLSSKIGHLATVVKEWISQLKLTSNEQAKVFVCGGDGKMIASMLNPGLSESDRILPIGREEIPTGFDILFEPRAVQIGVQHLLLQHTSKDPCPDEELRELLLGQRVLKEVQLSPQQQQEQESASVDASIAHASSPRGTIAAIHRGDTIENDTYTIIYDHDYVVEHTRPSAICDHLRSYKKHGENWTSDNPAQQKLLDTKMERSETAAHELEARIVSKKGTATSGSSLGESTSTPTAESSSTQTAESVLAAVNNSNDETEKQNLQDTEDLTSRPSKRQKVAESKKSCDGSSEMDPEVTGAEKSSATGADKPVSPVVDTTGVNGPKTQKTSEPDAIESSATTMNPRPHESVTNSNAGATLMPLSEPAPAASMHSREEAEKKKKKRKDKKDKSLAPASEEGHSQPVENLKKSAEGITKSGPLPTSGKGEKHKKAKVKLQNSSPASSGTSRDKQASNIASSKTIKSKKTKPKMIAIPDPVREPESVVKHRFVRYFPKPKPGYYYGTITSYRPPGKDEPEPFWHVLYDDDDEEDLNLSELQTGLKIYCKNIKVRRDDRNPKGLPPSQT